MSPVDVGNVKKQVSCLWQIGGMCYQSPRVFTLCLYVCVCVFYQFIDFNKKKKKKLSKSSEEARHIHVL